MFRNIRKWFGKESASQPPIRHSLEWIPKSSLPISPRSKPFPTELESFLNPDRDYLPPPGVDPRILFPLLRRLRDYIPDVSAGVWAWVRLCSTPLSFTIPHGTETEQEQARAILEKLDRRISGFQNERERGIENLIQCYFLSVFTYGAFCGEVVLDNQRRQIDRFIIIDPATIRFRLTPQSREYRPFQIQADGSLLALNSSSFYYFALDTDGLTPYGRSPLLALPLVIRLQQQLLHDMARAQHNAGYPTIHFRMTPPEKESRESPSDYNDRIHKELNRIRTELSNKEADSNLITFDNIEVQYLGPEGKSYQWSESLQAIGEQVISALHLAPFMIGRNWGTTQSWGNAQYQLLTNNARTVQEGAKRLAEWLRNLELILWDLPLTVVHQFAPHHHLDAFDRARAFQTSSQTLMNLSEQGFLEHEIAQQHIETLIRFL